METKLGNLTREKNLLVGRIAELEARQKTMRAEMEADPVHKAAALAPKFGELGVQLEVFNKKLAEVTKQLEAEQARLDSPAVKAGIKKAERIVADGQKLHGEIVTEVDTLLARINGAISASHEAADLLVNGDRSFLPHSGPYTELAELRNLLGQWVYARANRQAAVNAQRQQAAHEAARAAAKEKAEADEKARIEKLVKDRKARDANKRVGDPFGWADIGKRFGG